MSRKLNSIRAMKTEMIEVESDLEELPLESKPKPDLTKARSRALEFLRIKPWNKAGRVLLSIEAPDGRNIMSVSTRLAVETLD